MLLEKLEISGFKSFAKRTHLRLSSGITCVVGPNGCGKSNIADAIRWALGEQNVRQLRGKHLQDVIFKGTREVKPTGMAEVILHIDNQEQRLATEFSQVNIVRRAFRTGESEFRINKTACRLKDIRGLFMDTGLGSSDYAVIEREMIDEVLADRDEARRFLLDEAAGITRYKQRRKETLRKLTAVDEDLTRVEDVLEIEERQVRSLAYQMGKARRYQRLSQRIRDLDVVLARLEWKRLAEAASGESGRLQEEEKQRETLRGAQHSLEARQESVRLDVLKLDESLQAAQNKLNETEARLSETKEEALIRRERVKALRERTEDLADRIANSQRAHQTATAELDDLLPELEQRGEELEEKRAVADAADREWREAEVLLKEARAEMSRHQQIHIDHVRTCSNADHEIKTLATRLEDLDFQQQKLEAQIEALGNRAEGLGAELEELGGKRARADERCEQLRLQLSELRTERETAHGRFEELDEQRERLAEESARSESRLHLLEEQAKSYDGYREGVAGLLAHREELPGIIGSAAELISVDQAWVKRLSPALREISDWVVTRDEEAAWTAIDWLRRQRLGQVTFVPLEALGQLGRFPDGEEGGLPTGAIAVRDSDLEPLATYLRQSLVPVAGRGDLPAGGDRMPGRRWITEAGELLSPAGLLSAAGGDSPEEQIWNRPQEIDGLRDRIEQLGEERGEIEKQQAVLKSLEQQLRSTESTQQAELDEAQAEAESLARTLLQRQAEERLIKDEIGRLREDSGALNTRQEDTKTALFAARGGFSELEEAGGSAREMFEVAQEKVETAGGRKDELGERMSDRKMELVLAESKARDLSARIQSRREESEESLQAAKQAEEDLARTRSEIDETDARIKALSENEGDLVEQRESRGGEVERLRQDRRGLENQLAQADAQLREKRRQLSEVEEALRHDEVHLAKVEADRQRLRERIMEAYEVDLAELPPLVRPEPAEEDAQAEHPAMPQAVPTPAEAAEAAAAEALRAESTPTNAADDPLESLTEAEAAEKLTALRRERERLGPVNQLAIEEYDTKKEHVQFVKSQREDLFQSREALLTAIERINVEASRMFKDTFEQVQKNFARTFGTLFPGGEAELRLTSEDPLEASIEIMARPRGKRLESITLLSSGERALTATSLLFALYLVKPSPFCVLDEVDAPLDDANIDRFLNLLRSFSDRTQFIVISHNKRTMEVADTLYGVTMQEPGISKIVSVRLESGRLVTEAQDGARVELPEDFTATSQAQT